MDDIKKEMTELKKEMTDLKKEMQLLVEAVNKVSDQSSRLDNHINFVEGTYDTLKAPLDFITRKVNLLSGRKELE